MKYSVCYAFVVMVLHQKPASGALTKRSSVPAAEDSDSRIRYPDDGHRLTDADLPPECRGRTYCTVKPHNYPEKRFNDMFKAHKRAGPPAPPPALVVDPEVGNRQGDPDEQDNCESVVTFEPLYTVRAKDGQLRTVVQAPDADYVQKVRLETCVKRDVRCFSIFQQHASDYETFCKQKYNTWEVLVALGERTEKIKVDLPVCCSCHYRPTPFANRFGQPATTAASTSA